MTSRGKRRGFTLIELLVVIAIIALLVGLLLPALAKAKRNAASLKDSAQIKQIHQAMLSWANDHDGILPTPGLINRKPDIYLNQDRPGVGPEDHVKNNSANLYSAMIAQEYFGTDLVISPVEVNPKVRLYESYNFARYDPSTDTYWDGDGAPPGQGFSADISQNTNVNSNTSYYHLGLVGIRKKIKWRNSAGNNHALFGSRAPFDGKGEEGGEDADNYKLSQTLLMHGPRKAWVGYICYGDNHVEPTESFYPGLASYEPQGGELSKDNVFQRDFPDEFPNDPLGNLSGDAYLAMTKSISETTISVYQEELLP